MLLVQSTKDWYKDWRPWKEEDEWRTSKLRRYWERPEYWGESWRLEETYCYSNSGEKPSAKVDVKNSEISKIIIIIIIIIIDVYRFFSILFCLHGENKYLFPYLIIWFYKKVVASTSSFSRRKVFNIQRPLFCLWWKNWKNKNIQKSLYKDLSWLPFRIFTRLKQKAMNEKIRKQCYKDPTNVNSRDSKDIFMDNSVHDKRNKKNRDLFFSISRS